MVLAVAADFIEYWGYPLFFCCLLVTKYRRVSIVMIDWLFYQQYHYANVRKGEISSSFTTGMEFKNGVKLSFLPAKS